MTFARHAGIAAGLGHPPVRKRRQVPISLNAISPLVATFDIAWIVLLGVANGHVYHGAFLDQPGESADYLAFGIAVAALYSAFAHAAEVYRPSNLVRLRWQVGRSILIWVLLFGFLVTLVFLPKIGAVFSRGECCCLFAIGLAAMVVVRFAVAGVCTYVIASRVLTPQRVVVIGSPGELAANEILPELERFGYALAATFQVPVIAKPTLDEEVRARLRDVVTYVRRMKVDEVFLALRWDRPDLIEAVESELRILPLPVKLLPDTTASRILRHPLFEVGPVTSVELQRTPLSAAQRRTKRIMDDVLAGLALFLLLPFLVVIAIAVHLETPGPILFQQTRVGFNGRTFKIYKFRTMTTLDDGPTVVQATKNDKRVTRMGRLLRRLSIDELPQLLNVLRGDMSLVGPRPHALAHDNEYDRMIAKYAMRHKMKPGITGWAQINGFRGETRDIRMMERRVESDLWYIQYWSLWLDIRILLRTFVHILASRNAY